MIQEVTDSGRVPRSAFSLPNLDNSRISDQKSQYWEWLFGSFYGKQPEFEDHNLATVLSDCMGLVDVAESIGSVDRVREIVDLALLRQDNILWQSIASNPIAWTELGRRVHSPTIFREGAVHLVGQWPRIADAVKEDINEDVRELIDRKFRELEISKEAIEMRILGHYPYFTQRKAADKPGRPSYANDIYMWMSICFFRHWFAQAISEDRTRRAPDGGHAFYNALLRGGQAYLAHQDFQQFHKYFPMSSKACNVLEANMGVLKEDVKKFVESICVNRAHVKPEDFKLDYLTCVLINKEDMPWHVPEEERVAEIPNMWGAEGEDKDMEGAPAMPSAKKEKKKLGGTLTINSKDAENDNDGANGKDAEMTEAASGFFDDGEDEDEDENDDDDDKDLP